MIFSNKKPMLRETDYFWYIVLTCPQCGLEINIPIFNFPDEIVIEPLFYICPQCHRRLPLKKEIITFPFFVISLS